MIDIWERAIHWLRMLNPKLCDAMVANMLREVEREIEHERACDESFVLSPCELAKQAMEAMNEQVRGKQES